MADRLRQPLDTGSGAQRFARTQGRSLAPDVFIFHVSLYGPTLLTQLLASLPQATVMSEPSIIDSLLRMHHDHGGSDTVTLLRQAMLAMGQRRTGAEDTSVIKFDCWRIHSLRLLRQAFPAPSACSCTASHTRCSLRTSAGADRKWYRA